jgi:hypothetical protein
LVRPNLGCLCRKHNGQSVEALNILLDLTTLCRRVADGRQSAKAPTWVAATSTRNFKSKNGTDPNIAKRLQHSYANFGFRHWRIALRMNL